MKRRRLVVAAALVGAMAMMIAVGPWPHRPDPLKQVTIKSPSEAVPTAQAVPRTTDEPTKNTTIMYTDAGFNRPNISIPQGSSVTFLNQRPQRPMWVASNDHPEHLLYPEFDQGKALGYEPLPKDNAFTFTFTKKGRWMYHDHYDAALQGVINVD